MQISKEEARAFRRKQADRQLTSQQASQEIGINPITYKKLTTGGEVRNIIYKKAMQWLAKDY
ncbi:hypothetical protein PCY71_10320 [Streptococcus sp. SN3]|uniref:hypothetical protein n=1 Tax=Streptococcus sp. SN3 TaxID=3018246 RepID=UPI00263C68F5|nr:hypothetical protein [Streptococcus sp. SN3]MDN5012751.1 hypothetical protein [Streptococcus sp. SN3]